MKQELRLSFLHRFKERMSCLRSLWIAILLLAPYLGVRADENKHVRFIDKDNSELIIQVSEQNEKLITGVVVDSDGNTIPGASVVIKGSTKGTITDFDGKYSLSVDQENAILIFSFVGLKTEEVSVKGKTKINVTLASEMELLDDIVVVGYGIQKKASVVGAITQAKGDDLQKAGGVTNVGEALQGNLPGVTTISSSGLPGESDPLIFIRGQSSWNGDGQPLILVDGVERTMSDLDINEIENISVLKDASATAVYGVKGANGVILITTKRGRDGKAKLTLSANTTVKTYSKIPEKYDSYDAVQIGNESIMRELMYQPGVWESYIPMQIADKYRNPDKSKNENFIYPNVDWADHVLKDYATDNRVNMTVRGGSDFAKYFGSLSYQSVSDLFDGTSYPNGKGYETSFNYNRFNYRSNLDFDVTSTTRFSVNLSGFYGVQEKPMDDLRIIMNSIYLIAPSMYTPIYPDGFYGEDPAGDFNFQNPIAKITNNGSNKYSRFQINSDFEVEQKLDFITKGLKLKGKFSYDNNMDSKQQLKDNKNSTDNETYRIYDINGVETIYSPLGVNNFDFVPQPWVVEENNVKDDSRQRRLNYEFALNYSRSFKDKHNVTGLALFKREEFAIGNMFPRFREDWVSRITYDYKSKYFLDVSGAYNGSEQFGPDYRFDLFPSAAMGWMLSNENFMKRYDWVDKLKVRGSYGLVGDDNFGNPNKDRWKYLSQWGSGGRAYLDPENFTGQSPYTWYKETVVGNPELQWETAIKSNIGFEASVLNGKFTADFDYFREDRDNILIKGNDRSIPDLIGTTAPYANTGQVLVNGYELVLGANHQFSNGIKVWANYNLTDARDEIISKEEPLLTPFYLKDEGYPIGQPKSSIPGEILTSWDDVYMATPLTSGQANRRPGYFDLVDFNHDGNYDGTYDNTPYGYPVRPQRTWSLSTGASYKGIRLSVQFYGTQNATRYYNTLSFFKQTHLYYKHNPQYWSVDNPTATTVLSPWSLTQAADDPYRNYYDASMVRLKTVELAYDFPKTICKTIGIDGLKIFANGNNLYLWTDLPDDREHNDGNQYPTMKRFNFGININY